MLQKMILTRWDRNPEKSMAYRLWK